MQESQCWAIRFAHLENNFLPTPKPFEMQSQHFGTHLQTSPTPKPNACSVDHEALNNFLPLVELFVWEPAQSPYIWRTSSIQGNNIRFAQRKKGVSISRRTIPTRTEKNKHKNSYRRQEPMIIPKGRGKCIEGQTHNFFLRQRCTECSTQLLAS